MASRLLRSSWPGFCKCGARFRAGAMVLWDPGRPARERILSCPTCRPSSSSSSSPARGKSEAPANGAATANITVRIQGFRSQNPNGWAIATAKLAEAPSDPRAMVTDTDVSFCVLGVLGWPGAGDDGSDIVAARTGDVIRVEGFWKRHPEYGPEFRVSGFAIPQVEAAAQDVEGFLRVFRGIGAAKAREIVAHYGGTRETVLAAVAEGRLNEVKGVSEALAGAVRDEYASKRDIAGSLEFLQKIGVGPATAKAALLEWGSHCADFITEDPYILMDLDGVGFLRADIVAREKLGVAVDDPRRCGAAALFAVETIEREGHTWSPRDVVVGAGNDRLARRIRQQTGLTSGQLDSGLALIAEPRTIRYKGNEVTRPPSVVFDSELLGTPDAPVVFSASMHRAERNAARDLLRLLQAPVTPLAAEDVWGGLSPHEAQAAAVTAAANSGVVVVTGGPGVGKTFTTQALLALFAKARIRVVCAAPTGKAAQRMKEQTGVEASTIHRLLEYGPMAGGGLGFRRNSGHPLDAGAVVVDESSMIDVALFSALLRAIPSGTRLVLIGDVDQLPSVGPGRVLHDVIASGCVDVARLTHIFRQSSESAIPWVARDVNEGRRPVVPEGSKDVQVLAAPEYGDNDKRSDGQSGSEREAGWIADQLVRAGSEGAQVLVPQHDGVCGVKALNIRLQAACNPNAQRGEDCVEIGDGYHLWHGDRVIHTKNNYGLWVFNGEAGVVVELDPERLSLAQLENIQGVDADGQPVTLRAADLYAARKLVVVDYGDRRVAYGKSELKELKLAYALTIHKSQGSQFPRVAIPVHKSQAFMLSRALLYTAITRASEHCLLVGHLAMAERAAQNLGGADRRTSLKVRLQA